MKKIFGIPMLACILLSQSPLLAQTSRRDDKAYRETAAAFRDDIWSWKLKHFNDYKVPDAYKAYSSVVLARYTELNAGRSAETRRNNSITEITRQLVKLNDAAAVKQYSELSYTQFRKGFGFGSANKNSVFIGAHIIKENGKTIEVTSDDVVLTKDEKQTREAKLALPDLQPGDVLDYYVVKELDMSGLNTGIWPYYFTFFDDEPVLNYSVHCDIGQQFAAEFRRYNGAQDFIDTVGQDDNIILNVTAAHDLMLVPTGTFWISPARQFPFIELNLVKSAGINAPNARRGGELYRDQTGEVTVRDEMIDIYAAKPLIAGVYAGTVAKMSEPVADYYSKLQDRKEAPPVDSLAAALYYMFRFDFLFNKTAAFDVARFVELPKENMSSAGYLYLLAEYFNKHDFDAQLGLCTSIYSPPLTELLDKTDVAYICNVHAGHNMMFGVTDYYSPAFYVPAVYEGSDCNLLTIDAMTGFRSNPTYAPHPNVVIGRSDASDNVHAERITVTPDIAADQLNIARATSLTGHYKEYVQKSLLLLEDFYNYERSFFNDSRSLAERYKDNRGTRGVAGELDAAFADARKKQKDAFITEAKEWMEVDITDLKDPKILNPGVRHTAPSFDYASGFRLNGLMKRAGNNYIIEVGKMIGNPTSAEGKQRERTIDIYGPYARTVRTEITVQVPDGYTVEGLGELTKATKNSVGSFIVTARAEGNKVVITTEKIFLAANYTAKFWPQILAVMDAAADWKSSKLLLRKKA